MNKLNLLLLSIVSAIFALLSNIVASGLEQRCQLVSNELRWILVVGTFVVSFALLIWLEYRRGQADGNSRASINRLITAFGTKTGKISMVTKGAPPDVDANVAKLGPKTETDDIKMKYEDDKTD